MTEIGRLWNSIPDSWQVLDSEGRLVVESFWSGMEQLIVQLIADLNRVGIDPFIEFARPDKVDLWCRFDFSDGVTEIDIDDDILSIPMLQDSISDPKTRWTSGKEYSVSGGQIVWNAMFDPPDAIVWAPVVRTQNERVSSVLGGSVDVDLTTFNWDSTTALKTIRCLWYCYQHGPTMEHIRYALNALLALPLMAHAGKVVEVGAGSVLVRYGDTCFGVSDYEGTVVCGDPVPGKGSGVVTFNRRYLQVDDAGLCAVDDWVVPRVDSGQPARRIVQCHMASQEGFVLDTQTDGISSADGRVLTGGGDWSEVEPGDLLSILSPLSIAGLHVIAAPLAEDADGGQDGAFLQMPITAEQEGITYRVLRQPWIELSGELDPKEEITFSIVRPTFGWRNNMWIGSNLTDGVGGVHTIKSNQASIILCPEAAAPGAMRIEPNFYDPLDPAEEFDILSQSSVLPEAGDYLRRFEPILDGVRLNDWRTDDRWVRFQPNILSLTADGADSDAVMVPSTDGVVVGAKYLLGAASQTPIEVIVSSIVSGTVLELDKTISSDYTTERMALMIPARRHVEGLSGFFVVKAGAKASTSSDGLSLSDTAATFTTQIRPGDYVRLVTDAGVEHFAEVDEVSSDTALLPTTPLPTSLTNVYYQIVKRYVPEELTSVRIDVAPYAAEYYNRDLVEQVFNRIRPTHVGYTYADSAIEVINVANNPVEEYNSTVRLQELYSDLILQSQEPTIVDSMVNGADSVNIDFVVGPVRYQWILEEHFSTVIEYSSES